MKKGIILDDSAPLHIVLGENEYLDGVEITPDGSRRIGIRG